MRRRILLKRKRQRMGMILSKLLGRPKNAQGKSYLLRDLRRKAMKWLVTMVSMLTTRDSVTSLKTC